MHRDTYIVSILTTINKYKMKTNDTNNFAKRTASQVTAILRTHGVTEKAENTGDGRHFCIVSEKFGTRVAVKRAGFILERQDARACSTIYFRAF